MLVDSTNFHDVCPKILEDIRQCSFMALDFEFTGLFLNEDHQPSLFDTLEQRYAKMRMNVQHFIPCQFGLSIFAKEEEENRYNCKTYSFFCCPRFFGAPSIVFSADAESLEFLADNSFDFNKFALQGIPFLNEEQEKACRFYMQNKDQIKFPIHFTDLLVDLTSEITSWLSTRRTAKEPEMKKSLSFKKYTNSLLNYLVVSELRSVFPNIWVDLDDGPPSALVILYVTKEERQSLEFSVANEEESIIDYCLGLTRVIRGVIEARKTIVGNNMMVDLVMFFHHFIQPLPAKLSDFKRKILELFPVIYDVKSIVNDSKKDFPKMEQFFQARGLFELYTNCKNTSFFCQAPFQPQIEEILTNEAGDVAEKPHDAGFDAFATGYAFIRIATLIAISTAYQLPSWPELKYALRQFKNHINLIRAPFHYLDLAAKSQESVRPEWLVLTCRKKSPTLSSAKVSILLSAYDRQIDFKRLNSREYVLAVGNFKAARELIQKFRQDENYKIAKYDFLRHSSTARAILWASVLLGTTLSAFLLSRTWRS